MAVNIDQMKRLPRGAIPSPRHELAAATPHVPDPNVLVPASLLLWPTQMSFWGNRYYGDCVSAEEAFAKATAAPQTFIPESTVVAWAAEHDWLHGANLVNVMRAMRTQGFPLDGKAYDDGSFQSVDWTNDAALQSAIATRGPVKLGVGADKFDGLDKCDGGVTGGISGWTMYNYPPCQRPDHCVSLCGYGTVPDLVALFAERGVTITLSPEMPAGTWYAMFTWNSIGIVDRQSLLNMTYEAWVRTPVTVVAQTPTLYLTAQGGSGGIWTFDQTLQTTPTQLPSTDGLGFRSMAAVDDIFYLTTQGSDGIWTFDLTSQTTPTPIPSTANLGFAGIIAIGTTLYMTAQGSDGIWTFDLASQARPAQIASTAGLGFAGIVNVGSTLYLTTQGSDGIWTFDLTSQATPTRIASTAGLGFTGIVNVGSTLYLTTQGSDGIWTFDLASQATPTQIASTAGLGFTGIANVGDTLYLTTQGSDGIWTFDLTSQATPTQIASTAGLGFAGILFV